MTNKEFGENILQLRKLKGLTQLELAEKAGLHRSFISAIESGEQNPTLETIAQVAMGLSVTVADLFKASTANLTDSTARQVCFIKLGGTWDMVETDQGLMGTGRLDDAELQKMEAATGSDENLLFDRFRAELFQTEPLTEDVATHLSWAKDIGKLITGQFYPAFSGDSSNYRPALLAAVINYICQKIIDQPNVPVVIAMGTDTTDIVLPFLDVFLFDKQVLPVLVTGANRSHREKNSDAPANFYDLATVVHLPLLAGAYYVFHQAIYRGGDIVKIDPSEEPISIEGLTTFFAPHRTHTKVGFLDQAAYTTIKQSHVEALGLFTDEKLYTVINSIVTVDLGDVNAIEDEVAKIHDPKYAGVIVESHALGNAPMPIRKAVIAAAQAGKLVLNVSRSLIGDTNDRYYGSLSSINKNELLNESAKVLNGGKLNHRAAKAILTRALLEKRNQPETQVLIEEFLKRTFSN